jgi:hypothetical protein
MRRMKQLSKWMRFFAGKSWQWMRSRVNVRRLLVRAKSQRMKEIMPSAGIAAGAVAFGLWWENLGAAIFGAIGLCFLAGIYTSTEKLLVALQKSDKEPQVATGNGQRVHPKLENKDDLDKAIVTLKPWLANEVALTEEDAKQCCGVLVNAVAARAQAIIASEKLIGSAQLQTKFGVSKGFNDLQFATELPAELK